MIPRRRARIHRFVPALEAVASGPPLTYEPFYGLNEPAFSSAPDPRFLFHNGSRERTVQALVDALARGDRLMVVTGEPGVGKTMLCKTLRNALSEHAAVAVVDATDSLEHALRRALTDYGVSARSGPRTASRVDLSQALGSFAASLRSLGSYAVVAVDDAHRMPADVIGALAELAVRGPGVRRLRMVFVGEPSVATTLQHGELASLEPFIGVHARLEPLSPEEVDSYVLHRLAVAGPNARVTFDEDAMAVVRQATGGVPKLVNLVCDRALARGHDVTASTIGAAIVTDVAQQLGLGSARVIRGSLVKRARRALVVLLLMAIGAALGAWVFRETVARILGGYR